MRPTSLRLLLVTGMIGFAVGFLGARFWDLWTGAPPTVPWAAPPGATAGHCREI